MISYSKFSDNLGILYRIRDNIYLKITIYNTMLTHLFMYEMCRGYYNREIYSIWTVYNIAKINAFRDQYKKMI